MQPRNKKDKALAEGLKGFDDVWKRVSGAKNAQKTASRSGVKLMPNKGCNNKGKRFQGGR